MQFPLNVNTMSTELVEYTAYSLCIRSRKLNMFHMGHSSHATNIAEEAIYLIEGEIVRLGKYL